MDSMTKRIPDESRKEIIRLYDNGSGLTPAEIARQTGVSYSSVYGLTRVRQRDNPETGQPETSNGPKVFKDELGNDVIAKIERDQIQKIKVHGVVRRNHERNLIYASVLEVQFGYS